MEKALREATDQTGISVKEFTVAPMINPVKGLPFHQWWIDS